MVKRMRAGRAVKGEQDNVKRLALQKPYWHASLDELYPALRCNATGLSPTGAAERLADYRLGDGFD